MQPKPPQGFKDYLMNKCTYVLAGKATTRVRMQPPPQSLASQMKDLFVEQEKARYRLCLQVRQFINLKIRFLPARNKLVCSGQVCSHSQDKEKVMKHSLENFW